MAKKKNNKVLVAEDDPGVVKLMKKILSDEGYGVETAENGLAAMDQVRKSKPCLIVLDIMMPEMNGYEVCRSLKFDSPYKDIPILLLTARDQEIDARIGKLMGIHYLQKPLNREVFLATVRQILK